MHQIFPNRGRRANFIQANQKVELPGEGDGFSFTMTAPFGNEILKAVASTVQFSDLQDQSWAQQLFDQVEETNLRALSTRGIAVNVQERKAEIGESDPDL